MKVEEVVRRLCFGRDIADFFLLVEMEGWEKSLCWCSAGVMSTSGEVKLSSGVSLDDTLVLVSSRRGRSFINASFSLSFLRSFVRLAPRN